MRLVDLGCMAGPRVQAVVVRMTGGRSRDRGISVCQKYPGFVNTCTPQELHKTRQVNDCDKSAEKVVPRLHPVLDEILGAENTSCVDSSSSCLETASRRNTCPSVRI